MLRSYQLDHCSLLVSDLDMSVQFYERVFGFEPIPIEPGHPHIRWLAIGGLDALHLTEGDVEGIHLKKAIHFALRVQDLEGFVSDLKAKNIPFCDWPGQVGQIGSTPGGYRQVFIQDPDGYWVEINDHGRGDGTSSSFASQE